LLIKYQIKSFILTKTGSAYSPLSEIPFATLLYHETRRSAQNKTQNFIKIGAGNRASNPTKFVPRAATLADSYHQQQSAHHFFESIRSSVRYTHPYTPE